MFGVRGIKSFIDVGGSAVVNFLHDGFVQSEELYFSFGFANFVCHLNLGFSNGLNGFVTKEQGRDHDFFVNFIGTTFNHQDGIRGSGNAQVEVRFFNLGVGGVEDEFTVDTANPYGAHRSTPGDVGDHQCG